VLKDKRQNPYVQNISKIDNKIDDDDDMLCLFVCTVLCIQSVKCEVEETQSKCAPASATEKTSIVIVKSSKGKSNCCS
jgi:hypothetical protein